MMRRRFLVAVMAAILCAGAALADPVKLRVAWVSANSDAPLLMFGKSGIARHEGISYTLQAIHFQGSPPMITALATGDIDLVGLGFSTLPIAVLNAGMTDLRIVADLFQDGVAGHYSNEFLVLTDGPIHTIDDLKGRIAATNAAGSAIDMVLRAMLKKHGIDDKRDVTIIEAAFPNMPAMLHEHKVDLIAGARPFTADPAVRAFARTLFTQREAIGRSEMALLAARTATIAKDRAAIVDYLEDELRAIRWYTDPAPRRGGEDFGRLQQAAGEPLRKLDVHQGERFLPRSRRASRLRCASGQHRDATAIGVRQKHARRQAARRSQPCERGGGATAVE